MDYIFKEMTCDDFDNCAKEFVLAFKEAPWNEEWTLAQAKDRFKEIMSSPISKGFVIYDGECVVSTLCGRLMTYMDLKEFWIDDFSVHPAYQGQGMGKKMLQYMKSQLEVDRYLLYTMRGYYCQLFYERQGFQLENDMIIMSHEL